MVIARMTVALGGSIKAQTEMELTLIWSQNHEEFIVPSIGTVYENQTSLEISCPDFELRAPGLPG